MQTISETEKTTARPMHLEALYNAFWGYFAKIPDWAMSLLSRFAVAGIFWRSGQTKVTGWELNEFTYMLFETEYALPFIPFKVAAESAVDGRAMSVHFLGLNGSRTFQDSAKFLNNFRITRNV